jgi:toxin ParE1/3/4
VARVHIVDAAEADKSEILDYLFHEAGIAVAETYAQKVARLFDDLALHPESGAPRSRLGKGIRLRLIDPYNVYTRYDAATDTVRILRILHGRRKITRGMMSPV